MTATKNGLVIFERLVILSIEGFKPANIETDNGDYAEDSVDPAGSANYFVGRYGYQDIHRQDVDAKEIIATDFQGEGSEFTVLISGDKEDSIREFAEECGYVVTDWSEVVQPIEYGDQSGTVEILQHRNGWTILG